MTDKQVEIVNNLKRKARTSSQKRSVSATASSQDSDDSDPPNPGHEFGSQAYVKKEKVHWKKQKK